MLVRGHIPTRLLTARMGRQFKRCSGSFSASCLITFDVSHVDKGAVSRFEGRDACRDPRCPSLRRGLAGKTPHFRSPTAASEPTRAWDSVLRVRRRYNVLAPQGPSQTLAEPSMAINPFQFRPVRVNTAEWIRASCPSSPCDATCASKLRESLPARTPLLKECVFFASKHARGDCQIRGHFSRAACREPFPTVAGPAWRAHGGASENLKISGYSSAEPTLSRPADVAALHCPPRLELSDSTSEFKL